MTIAVFTQVTPNTDVHLKSTTDKKRKRYLTKFWVQEATTLESDLQESTAQVNHTVSINIFKIIEYGYFGNYKLLLDHVKTKILRTYTLGQWDTMRLQ